MEAKEACAEHSDTGSKATGILMSNIAIDSGNVQGINSPLLT